MLGRLTALAGWALRRLARRDDPIILMYHRVADTAVDPWGLSVPPDLFDAQMQVLARTRKPVSLDWLAAELAAGRRPRGAVAVTFDDAYLDVLLNAKPSLERHGVPATVFVVSDAIGAPGFWWDELAEVVLGGEPPPKGVALPCAGSELEAALASGDVEQLHMALWRALRVLSPADRDAALGDLSRCYGRERPITAPIMSEADLLRLTEGGLVELGVHTRTHPSLPSLSTQAQREEIAGCKAAIEALTGRTNRRLAYPFGDFDARSQEIARELGFDYAVSVNAGPATSWSRRYELPRNDVKAWSAEIFRRRLKWFA